MGRTPPKVFISHASRDCASAYSLAGALEKQGLKPWLDLRHLEVGKDWREQLEQSIKESDAVVFLVSGSAAESPWVKSEWESALTASWEKPGLRLIPVVEADVQAPGFLRDRVSIQYFSDEAQSVGGPAADWSRIAKEIEAALEGGEERDEPYRAEADEKRRAYFEQMRRDLAPLVEAESQKHRHH